MSTFEIRRDSLAIVGDGEDELDVVTQAVDAGILEEGDAVSVAEFDGRPVGADGVDPEDPDDDPRGPNPVPR